MKTGPGASNPAPASLKYSHPSGTGQATNHPVTLIQFPTHLSLQEVPGIINLAAHGGRKASEVVPSTLASVGRM